MISTTSVRSVDRADTMAPSTRTSSTKAASEHYASTGMLRMPRSVSLRNFFRTAGTMLRNEARTVARSQSASENKQSAQLADAEVRSTKALEKRYEEEAEVRKSQNIVYDNKQSLVKQTTLTSEQTKARQAENDPSSAHNNGRLTALTRMLGLNSGGMVDWSSFKSLYQNPML